MGPEALKNHHRRLAEGFYSKYLSGASILDIGYQGSSPSSTTITPNAVGVGLNYPGYDGRHLPFENESQDGVFASHCLEHIVDYKTALAEWYRVLKIGGYMIIAVPHRDLYERKATLPSRFNGFHVRFNTPASLLGEIEDSLPVAGYRIRSMKDVDDGFDYGLPPDDHAKGCYEIELVVQKIAIPAYVDRLRLTRISMECMRIYANLLWKAVQASKVGRAAEMQEIVAYLGSQPLPPFAQLKKLIRDSDERLSDQDIASDEDLLKEILRPIVAMQSFDGQYYKQRYGIDDGQVHYERHGYFEGRSPRRDYPYA